MRDPVEQRGEVGPVEARGVSGLRVKWRQTLRFAGAAWAMNRSARETRSTGCPGNRSCSVRFRKGLRDARRSCYYVIIGRELLAKAERFSTACQSSSSPSSSPSSSSWAAASSSSLSALASSSASSLSSLLDSNSAVFASSWSSLFTPASSTTSISYV